MKNYKIALITLVVSFNANADIFNDIGDWVENNKAVTAIVGIGALTAAAAAIKPLSGLIRKEASALTLEVADVSKLSEIEASGFAGLAEGGATEISAGESLVLSDVNSVESLVLTDVDSVESLGLPEAKTGNFDRLNRQKNEAEEFANARIERYKVAQREAEQANKIAAAKELEFMRGQPQRPMPWQKQPRFKPITSADQGYAEDVLNRLAKGGKY
jgi:hypothetical protein